MSGDLPGTDSNGAGLGRLATSKSAGVPSVSASGSRPKPTGFRKDSELLGEIYPDGPCQTAEANLPREIYFSEHYFSRRQLFSQAAQINMIHGLKPRVMLEVGIGNGIVSSMMRKAGASVTTFDINASLKPDIVGSVLDIEAYFEEFSFDLISCCEVLEHLPLAHFEDILSKFYRLTRTYVYLTLPRAQMTLMQFIFGLKIPYVNFRYRDLFISLPRRKIAWEHCWEIDHSPETRRRRISGMMSKCFDILVFEREIQNPYHIHIVLKRKNLP